MHLRRCLAVVNRPPGGRPSMGGTREEPPGRHAAKQRGGHRKVGRSEGVSGFPARLGPRDPSARSVASSSPLGESQESSDLPTFLCPPLFSSAGGFAAWRLPLLFGVVTGVTQADEQKLWTRSMRTCRPQAKPSIGIRSSWPWNRLV